MIRRALNIGRWLVEFYFAGEDGYDTDELIDRLYDFGADIHSLRKAWSLMESDLPNTGFTFSNQQDRLAIVAIGPTSSGAEFQDTFVHEVHHLETRRGISPRYYAGSDASTAGTDKRREALHSGSRFRISYSCQQYRI